MAITNDTVLLDILKSVTRIEGMLAADEKEDKSCEGEGELPTESPDPELFSVVLETLPDFPNLFAGDN